MQVNLDSVANKHIIEVYPVRNCGHKYDPVPMTMGVNAKFLGNRGKRGQQRDEGLLVFNLRVVTQERNRGDAVLEKRSQ